MFVLERSLIAFAESEIAEIFPPNSAEDAPVTEEGIESRVESLLETRFAWDSIVLIESSIILNPFVRETDTEVFPI